MAEGLVVTIGGGSSTVTVVNNTIVEGAGVTGPQATVNDRLAAFEGTTGQQLKDSGRTIAEILDAAAALAAAGDDAVAQTSFLVSGGSIAWLSAYTFRVSAAVYYIAGIQINAAEQNVTLGTADPTNGRIDVIAVDGDGDVIVVEGTASAQPAEPDVDPATQLKLGVVFVGAATSAPAAVSKLTLWAEQAGSPTEWVWSAVGTGFTIGSTNQPYAGTKSIEGTNVVKAAYAQAQLGSGYMDPNDYDTLAFFIRSKATWNTNRGLKFQWHKDGTAVGQAITIAPTGTFGFDSSLTSGYQLIVMSVPQFAVPKGSQINQLRIIDTNGAIGFYLDDIVLQTGLPDGLFVSTLSVTQADARYVKLPLYRYVGFTLSSPSAAMKRHIQMPFGGLIVGWSLTGDVSGSISIDVCKKAGTQSTPQIPNTTSDKISASAPMVLSSQQAKGGLEADVSTWSTAVVQWDTILVNIVSASGLAWVSGWIRVKSS